MHGQPSTVDGRVVEPVEQRRSAATLPSLGTRRASASSSRAAAPRQRAAASSAGGVGEPQADVAAGDQPLQLLRRCPRRPFRRVEHGDPVGELVGLLQVLGGEEDGDAAGDQLADDLPHGPAAARVEAGGRLVEEDDPRVADQRHRQVEPAPHAAGVGRDRLPGRVGQVEPLEQLGGAAPALGRPRWCRSAIRSRFSSPVSSSSTAENCPVTPIAARTASGSLARSWPATRPSRRRRRSAWTGSAPSSSCPPRSARAGRTPSRPATCRSMPSSTSAAERLAQPGTRPLSGSGAVRVRATEVHASTMVQP